MAFSPRTAFAVFKEHFSSLTARQWALALFVGLGFASVGLGIGLQRHESFANLILRVGSPGLSMGLQTMILLVRLNGERELRRLEEDVARHTEELRVWREGCR